jgi:hypothetical protein
MLLRGITAVVAQCAFSKKIENHVAAISLHFMYYNFVRIHQTLRIDGRSRHLSRLGSERVVKLLKGTTERENHNRSSMGQL